MKDFLARLTSRKFLLALGTALTAYGNGNDKAALIAIGAYIGVEGLADIAAVFAKYKYTEPAKVQQRTELIQSGALEADPVDKNVIAPGTDGGL